MLQHLHLPEKDLKKDTPVMEIHIPATGPLIRKECEESIKQAREFFARYFPDFGYPYFYCHSWLLDTELIKYLPVDSNILQFQKMFEIVTEEESDDILKFVFTWDTTRDNLKDKECTSGLARKVKEDALNNSVFYVGQGVIKKN